MLTLGEKKYFRKIKPDIILIENAENMKHGFFIWWNTLHLNIINSSTTFNSQIDNSHLHLLEISFCVITPFLTAYDIPPVFKVSWWNIMHFSFHNKIINELYIQCKSFFLFPIIRHTNNAFFLFLGLTDYLLNSVSYCEYSGFHQERTNYKWGNA